MLFEHQLRLPWMMLRIKVVFAHAIALFMCNSSTRALDYMRVSPLLLCAVFLMIVDVFHFIPVIPSEAISNRTRYVGPCRRWVGIRCSALSFLFARVQVSALAIVSQETYGWRDIIPYALEVVSLCATSCAHRWPVVISASGHRQRDLRHG